MFYPGDVLRDTQFFTAAQKGCYLDVLNSHIENISFSYDFLMKITRSLSDVERAEFLQIFERENDGYFIGWVVNAIKKRSNYLASRGENKKGKKKKRKKNDVKITSKSYENHMVKENEYKEENKKETENEKSLHRKMQLAFIEIYDRKKAPLKYQWSGADGKCLKEIIPKIRSQTNEGNEETIHAFWQSMVEHLPDWYFAKGFSVPIINKNFNVIVSQIHKPHATNTSTLDRQVAEILKRGNPYA